MKAIRTVVGVDTAKRVFQLHWVELETGEIVDLRLSRAKFLEHFANRSACVVGMEACGGAQHWARRLRELGHEVRLVPVKMVRPFVGGNKNDAADARAIWTAVQQPGIKTVAVKSEEQQASTETRERDNERTEQAGNEHGHERDQSARRIGNRAASTTDRRERVAPGNGRPVTAADHKNLSARATSVTPAHLPPTRTAAADAGRKLRVCRAGHDTC